MEKVIQQIEVTLESLLKPLVNELNQIYKFGIPAESKKIVIWIPLGTRYNLNFTYMDDTANEVGDSYPQLSSLDHKLENLLKEADTTDCNALKKISYQTDDMVAAWLKKALDKSDFANINLHKVMAINNVCAYFDLETLELLDEDEMWI